MAPVLELTYDVGSYFPPVIDSWGLRGVVAVFQGKGESVSPVSLKHQLAMRLRAVIAYARSQDESHGPVAVIGHSLGSIIALTALEQTPEAVEVGGRGEPPVPLEIDLVTMGSPLRLLATRFPHLYGSGDGMGSGPSGIRRWLNLYRPADPIGRDLGKPTGSDGHPVDFEERDMCNGGHSRYFEDLQVAGYLIRWLFRRGQKEVAAPVLQDPSLSPAPFPDGPERATGHLAADCRDPEAPSVPPTVEARACGAVDSAVIPVEDDH
jgi:hypothetical protein